MEGGGLGEMVVGMSEGLAGLEVKAVWARIVACGRPSKCLGNAAGHCSSKTITSSMPSSTQ